MKKFKEYIIRLKPYKRKYRIFLMLSFITISFILMQILFILSYAVPHKNGGYYYFFGGFHKFSQYTSETNACLGFVVSAFILCYIPIIILIPFLYFNIANYLIYEVISEKFQSLSFNKYNWRARNIHFSIISATFFIVTSIFIFSGGANPFHITSVFELAGSAFDDGAKRFCGIAAILHIGVAYLFGLIVIVSLIIAALKWVWRKIETYCSYLYNKYIDWKKRRLEEKLARKNNKQKNKI